MTVMPVEEMRCAACGEGFDRDQWDVRHWCGVAELHEVCCPCKDDATFVEQGLWEGTL